MGEAYPKTSMDTETKQCSDSRKKVKGFTTFITTYFTKLPRNTFA